MSLRVVRYNILQISYVAHATQIGATGAHCEPPYKNPAQSTDQIPKPPLHQAEPVKEAEALRFSHQRRAQPGVPGESKIRWGGAKRVGVGEERRRNEANVRR